jgi:hypothetical protein
MNLSELYANTTIASGVIGSLLLMAIALWAFIFRRMEVDSGRKGLKK